MRSGAVLVLTTFLCASALGAQSEITTFPTRFSVGGDVVLSQPKSEFANNVGNGYGFDLTGLFKVDPKGFFNLRADLGGIQYGRETKRIPFQPITGRIRLDLETDNRIGFAAIGTQLQIPDGWIRPYANAAIAVTNFSTQSSLSGSDDSFETITSTNASDNSHAWIFGGGVTIPFGRFSTGALNIGARYFYGGTATYLTEGDIIDNPDGTITLNPRNSKTDLVLWQLGASFVIPRTTRR
jgi:hypothetical protein